MRRRSSGPDKARIRVRLTPAETRVLSYLPTHLTLTAIGLETGVARSTVKTQVATIYAKLGVHDRAQAVERAQRAGLL